MPYATSREGPRTQQAECSKTAYLILRMELYSIIDVILRTYFQDPEDYLGYCTFSSLMEQAQETKLATNWTPK